MIATIQETKKKNQTHLLFYNSNSFCNDMAKIPFGPCVSCDTLVLSVPTLPFSQARTGDLIQNQRWHMISLAAVHLVAICSLE